MHPNVHSIAIYSSQDMKQPKCPWTEEWREDMEHICNGILLSHKKEQNNAICSNMDRPRDCHTE